MLSVWVGMPVDVVVLRIEGEIICVGAGENTGMVAEMRASGQPWLPSLTA